MCCCFVGCGTATRMTQSVYAQFRSRSYDAVIRVYDEPGNVIAMHERASVFREP